MIRWLKRLITTAIIVGLLISNALSLTSSAFNAMLSGAIAGVTGIKTLNQLNAHNLTKQRNAVKRMGSRIKIRATRIAARSTMRSTVSWIPVMGASIAVALTVWELADLCEGMKDLDQLYQDMDIDEETPLEICRADPE